MPTSYLHIDIETFENDSPCASPGSSSFSSNHDSGYYYYTTTSPLRQASPTPSETFAHAQLPLKGTSPIDTVEHISYITSGQVPEFRDGFANFSSRVQFINLPNGYRDDHAASDAAASSGDDDIYTSDRGITINGSDGQVKKRRNTRKRREWVECMRQEAEFDRDYYGNAVLPIVTRISQGVVSVLELGEIYPYKGFYDKTHIFPVGYRAIIELKDFRFYDSANFYNEDVTYQTIIRNDGGRPRYDVYIDDESTPVATGYTASGAWKSILEAFTSKGLAGFTNIGGPKMIGLADYRVLKAIEELPGADQCEGYNKMQLID